MPIPHRTGRSALPILASLLLASAAAAAHEYRAGDLVIVHPWTRATPTGATVAGGYMTITNRGTTPDALVGGSAAVAAGFALHEMRTENGVMVMRPTGPLAIPPGGTVTLAPGGIHVMMTGLTRELKRGESVEGTLTFAHAGTMPVRFAVEAIGARAPAEQDTATHGDAASGDAAHSARDAAMPAMPGKGM